MRKNIKRIKITRNIFTHFPGSMIKPKFFGREKELALLRKQRDIVREQHTSRFVVVSGRRRVGKTRLILEALSSTEDMPTIYTYLNPQLDEASNLSDFSLAFQDGLGVRHAVRFSSFEEAISSVFEEAAARPITLVIDEFQNLSQLNPGVFGLLQKLWDLQHENIQLLLVVCGSVASSMRESFENGRAPLFARNNAVIRVEPFLPDMVKTIFQSYSPNFSGDDLLALYAFTGGVAQYLQNFLPAGCFTLRDMLRSGIEENSVWLSEAQLLLASEFKGNATTYHEILKRIAAGKNKRAELVGSFDIDISAHLYQLQHYYGLIEAMEPVADNGAKRQRIAYELNDELLDFWYSFLLPNQRMLQSHNSAALQELILENYPTWSGRILERLYRRHFCNLGLFTRVGPWWDRKGENEIDLVAINEAKRTIYFAEIKRNPDKVDFSILQSKVQVFLSCNPQYVDYDRTLNGLSLSELAACSKLPFED